MKPGTRRVINALSIGAFEQAKRRGSIMALFEFGLIIGIQVMQVDPEFGSAFLRDFLGGMPDDDDDVAMYWGADQTVAALKEAFESSEGEKKGGPGP